MSQMNRTPRPRGSRDPQLGGDRAIPTPRPEITGFEPLLGGMRRIGPDMRRIQALLEANADERANLIEHLVGLGQARLYAEELILVVPARARAKSGNWRGTFTAPQRIAAMEALALIGGAESIGVLLATLADSIYDVRHAAERALIAICARLDPADVKTVEVIHTMVRAMGLLPMSARKIVARILAARPPDLVMPPLLRDGLTAPDWQTRREAAWILGTLGDRRATKRLIDVLEGDASETVRATAAWALGRFDAPIAVQPLIGVVQSSDEIVRAAAIEALGEHANRHDPEHDDFHPLLQTLVSALQDEYLSVRHTAVDVLTALIQPEARAAIAQMLKR
jgi:HEAT repeat protein